MAMNKKEQAEMERLRSDLALARALRWPEYPTPQPMTREEIEENLVDGGMQYGRPQKVARGWFLNAYSRRLTFGCSTVVSHNTDGDTTSTQCMGVMYRTKAEAARAMRITLTEKFATELAKVDRIIQECDQ